MSVYVYLFIKSYGGGKLIRVMLSLVLMARWIKNDRKQNRQRTRERVNNSEMLPAVYGGT